MGDYKPYVVRCSEPGCSAPAEYKIAARWTDGTLVELKSYAFACEKHREPLLERSRERRAQCHLSEGEQLDPVVAYSFTPGKLDSEMLGAADNDG
jgi:hypothetical protein